MTDTDTEIDAATPDVDDTETRPVGYRVELPDGTVRVATEIHVSLPKASLEVEAGDIGRPGQDIRGTWRARFTSKLDFDGDRVVIPLKDLRLEVIGLVSARPADPTLFDAEAAERAHQYRFRVADGIYVVECSCGELTAEGADEVEAHAKGRRHVRLAVLGHKSFVELAEGQEGYTVGCMCGWRGDGVASDEEQAGMWIERHLEEAKDETLPAPPRDDEDSDDDADPGLD